MLHYMMEIRSMAGTGMSTSVVGRPGFLFPPDPAVIIFKRKRADFAYAKS